MEILCCNDCDWWDGFLNLEGAEDASRAHEATGEDVQGDSARVSRQEPLLRPPPPNQIDSPPDSSSIAPSVTPRRDVRRLSEVRIHQMTRIVTAPMVRITPTKEDEVERTDSSPEASCIKPPGSRSVTFSSEVPEARDWTVT